RSSTASHSRERSWPRRSAWCCFDDKDRGMALPLRAALRSASRFMVKNPTTMLSMARHALGMRIAVPLDALRWFIANTPPSKKAPQDVTITPRPPAIGIGATIDLMGTTVRAGASIRVDQIEVSDTAF